MPGTRWFSFRQGNRSEYLALYILSALGIVVKVPIEEDIGADFHCSLAKVEKNKMTFQAPFIVQIKSKNKSKAEKITYGGINDKKKWKKDEVEWLFNQELPLLIGIADKKNGVLELFTTSSMWVSRYYSGENGLVVLQPNVPSGNGEDLKIPKPIEMKDWPSGIGDGKKWKVPLGPPLVSINIDDIENNTKIDLYREILLRALIIEQENITYRRLQVHFAKYPSRIETNKLEGFIPCAFYVANRVPGKNTDNQLKAIAPIIATLSFNYKIQGKIDEIQHLKPIARLIPDCREIQMLKRDVPELFD